MKFKTSLFNPTVFFNLLQRYWLIFVGYTFALGSFQLISLINFLQDRSWNGIGLPNYATFVQYLQSAPNAVIVVNFFAAGITAALLFSFLYNARHTGMMASLPLRRETVYGSVYAAGFLGLTLCNVLVTALALVVELAYGEVSLIGLGIVFAVSELSLLLFYGMACFCCMLTGNIFAGPAVYAIFNVAVVGAESIIWTLCRELVYGMGYGYQRVTTFLSPLVEMLSTEGLRTERITDADGRWVDYTWTMNGMGELVIYALVGLVLAWLGMRLYKNRRMETAGDTISIEILKPIFKFCMTVGTGLVFAVFIQELLYEVTPTEWMAAAYTAVLLIIGGTGGYFIAQMLIARALNVFRTGWKTVAIYAVAVVAVVFAIEFDLFGYEQRVPAAEDVQCVEIGYAGSTITFQDDENIATAMQLHRNIIANKALHETELGSRRAVAYVGDADSAAVDFYKDGVALTYMLENGKTISRRYNLSYGPDEIRNSASEIRVLEALLNTEEGIRERLVMKYPVTAENIESCSIEYVDGETMEYKTFYDLTPSQWAQLYNDCILPDIADGNLGVLNIIENKDYAQSKYNCTIRLWTFGDKIVNAGGGETYVDYNHIDVYLTLTAERTVAFLKELGIEPATVYDAALARGWDYNDVGTYEVGNGAIDDAYAEKMRDVGHTEIIGGADGPTAIYVK